jgi:hypothetical protein
MGEGSDVARRKTTAIDQATTWFGMTFQNLRRQNRRLVSWRGADQVRMKPLRVKKEATAPVAKGKVRPRRSCSVSSRYTEEMKAAWQTSTAEARTKR